MAATSPVLLVGGGLGLLGLFMGVRSTLYTGKRVESPCGLLKTLKPFPVFFLCSGWWTQSSSV